jgi:hypothetical protein
LEGKRGELGRLLEESLLKADSHTKLIVNEPDGTDVDDGHALLPLLDRVKGDWLLAHIVSLGDKGAVRLSGNLELESRGVRLLAWANHGLVESLTKNCDIKLLTEPLLRVLGDRVHDDIVKLLELVVKLHGLSIIGIKGKIEGVRSASSTLIGEGTQTIGGAHEGELDVELLVVTTIKVDGLAAILVLTKFREANRLGREIGGSLDSEGHCVDCIIHLLGGLTLSNFFCPHITNIIMGLFKDCGCGCDGQKQQEKFITSLISGLTFFVIANPETFRLVRRVLGPGIATPNGCPSTMGLIVHSVVFILVVWAMMNVRKETPDLGAIKEKVKREEKKVVPPPAMVDAPSPLPDMAEPQIEMRDTGLQLGSYDITAGDGY